MLQPTKKEISEKIYKMLEGKLTREYISSWAFDYIKKDEEIVINDIEAWHYLVAVSSIDLKISPEEYLYDDSDIMKIFEEYDHRENRKC